MITKYNDFPPFISDLYGTQEYIRALVENDGNFTFKTFTSKKMIVIQTFTKSITISYKAFEPHLRLLHELEIMQKLCNILGQTKND